MHCGTSTHAVYVRSHTVQKKRTSKGQTGRETVVNVVKWWTVQGS